LEDVTAERKQVESKLADAKSELDETLRLAEEVEQAKDDLFNLLSNTITELESAKANAKATEDELRRTLSDESSKKEVAQAALQAKIKEFETALANWKIERAELLQKIAELETEIDNLQLEMQGKLQRIAEAKSAALARALSDREKALRDAQNEKDLALDKVRMLLTGNTKQGYLWIYASTLMGMQWKKKFFSF